MAPAAAQTIHMSKCRMRKMLLLEMRRTSRRFQRQLKKRTSMRPLKTMEDRVMSDSEGSNNEDASSEPAQHNTESLKKLVSRLGFGFQS